MAGQKLTDKTELTDNLATTDKLMVVDASDTSGSAQGTSKFFTPHLLNVTEKVSIDNTAFKNLPTSAATLVGFPGAGYVTVPLSVLVKHTPGSTPNTQTMGIKIGFVDGSTSQYWGETRFWPDSPTYVGQWFEFGQTFGGIKGLSDSTIENQKLLMYATGNVSATATDTLDVYVTYKRVKI
tara:strand:+ start:969 stop:1511 length:543 start_codon:yes stop_codon:yes gene_type:complete